MHANVDRALNWIMIVKTVERTVKCAIFILAAHLSGITLVCTSRHRVRDWQDCAFYVVVAQLSFAELVKSSKFIYTQNIQCS